MSNRRTRTSARRTQRRAFFCIEKLEVEQKALRPDQQGKQGVI
jgi:hypothetical protein